MSALTDQLRARLTRSVENFNPQGAHNTLDEMFASLSIEAALSEVVLPFVECLEREAESDVAHVQFATSLLKGRLLAVGDGWADGGSPTVLVGYPSDERHTFGGLAFCLALRDRGWRIIYLGTSASVRTIVETARGSDAQAVVLAAREPSTFAGLRGQLAALDERSTLALAGRGATAPVARRLGAVPLPRHPVIAARELDRRLGTASRRRSGVARAAPVRCSP